MNTLPRPRPLLVVILDGWGLNSEEQGNAIAAAKTPTMDNLARYFPTTAVAAAGLEVGLPPGQCGNSETGHRNIGAGRVEYQILTAIDRAIADSSFETNPVLIGAIEHTRHYKSSLHLMGLVSRGGVHSHFDHLLALLRMAAGRNLRERVYVHMFTDGRDAPQQSALGYAESLEEAMGKYGLGTIASVTGRFYAMDRNRNWERTQTTYDMLTGGKRPPGSSSAKQAIERAYNNRTYDEMIPPTVITRGGAPLASVTSDDAVIFFNFRPDRARQLTRAFVSPHQMSWPTVKLENVYFSTLAKYDIRLKAKAAFVEEVAEYPLARVIAEGNLKQLHIAETEKYAHITYYLNVGHEKPFPGEERVLMRSSGVRNFAENPQMEAKRITERVLVEMKSGKYDVYFINYANADMAGHTGDFEATRQACQFVDESVGQLQTAVLSAGGAMVVTADHGSAEELLVSVTHEKRPEHTSNPVPFHYVRGELKRTTAKSDSEMETFLKQPVGVLADVAPTILDILRLDKPASMTGVSLLGSLQ
ncbi:MAG: 2,3-bisphosphoglycerate-independent phosphoglycerate mutase [bacterium]